MSPILAHQGGWDELLLAAVLVLVIMGVSRVRRRGPERTSPASLDPGGCAYCGAPIQAGDRRCPACGFRVTR